LSSSGQIPSDTSRILKTDGSNSVQTVKILHGYQRSNIECSSSSQPSSSFTIRCNRWTEPKSRMPFFRHAMLSSRLRSSREVSFETHVQRRQSQFSKIISRLCSKTSDYVRVSANSSLGLAGTKLLKSIN